MGIQNFRGFRVAVLTAGVLMLLSAGAGVNAQDRSGLDVTGMDRSVAAGDDFWRYANGRHLDALEIPADKAEYGVGGQVSDRTNARLIALVSEQGHSRGDRGTGAEQVRWLYRAYLDANARGSSALATTTASLAAINAAPDHKTLVKTLSAHDGLMPLPFTLAIGMNYRAPKENVLSLAQGGLGLRLHHYEAADTSLLDAYTAYLDELLKLAGVAAPDAAKIAASAVRQEQRFAKAWLSPLQARSLRANYQLVSLQALQKANPRFPWQSMLDASGIDLREKPVAVYGFDAINGLANAWTDAPIEDLRAWAMTRVMDRAAPLLSKDFVAAHHAFHGKRVQGVAAAAAPQQTALKVVGDVLPFALGRLYVERHFDAASKRQLEGMVDRIRAVMARRIQAVDWLEDSTRARALVKLQNLHVEVGYPETWPDFASLQLDGALSLPEAMRRIHRYNWDASVQRLHQPVDPAKGTMPPHWVGAGFTGTGVVFAAGILQAPYFDADASLEANYGAIGATIGHEITHAFDDTGLEFDEFGAVSDDGWWTQRDLAAFKQRAQVLVTQFGRYQPLPGIPINGALTLGENLADLGGLSIAYEAYRDALEGQPAPAIDGLTGDQRFFIAYAQQWRSKPTENYLRTRLQSDVHSPAQWRVNGIVRNLPEWRAAFGVKPDASMHQSASHDAKVW